MYLLSYLAKVTTKSDETRSRILAGKALDYMKKKKNLQNMLMQATSVEAIRNVSNNISDGKLDS